MVLVAAGAAPAPTEWSSGELAVRSAATSPPLLRRHVGRVIKLGQGSATVHVSSVARFSRVRGRGRGTRTRTGDGGSTQEVSGGMFRGAANSEGRFEVNIWNDE